MRVTSTAFKQGESIPKKYTCEGHDIQPPLTLSDVPKTAVSLALIMDDPDVPDWVRADRLWVHWVMYNIDPSTTEIKEGISPKGTLGQNTGGQNAYMGPCPPDREHRYFFKVYALDTKLSLGLGATKEELESVMEGHILEHSSLMGRYVKNNR